MLKKKTNRSNFLVYICVYIILKPLDVRCWTATTRTCKPCVKYPGHLVMRDKWNPAKMFIKKEKTQEIWNDGPS